MLKNEFIANNNFIVKVILIMSGSRKFNDKSNLIADNLVKYRKKKGMSQRVFCQKLELIGVSLFRSDLYCIEHNKRSVKDFELLAFAKVLEVPVEDLFDDISIFDDLNL